MPAIVSSKKVRTAFCAVLVVASLLIGLTVLSNISRPKDTRFEAGMINPEANAVVGEATNSIDVLFVGDSEMFSSFSPMVMWNESGFTSYVCATSKQQLPYSNTLLRRAATRQRPRVVVFETNSIYAPLTADDVIGRTAADFFPVFEYHNRWKTLAPGDFTKRPHPRWTDDLKGFYIRKQSKPADTSHYMEPTDASTPIPFVNGLYLQAMVDYCRSIDAIPVLISTPSTTNWNTAKHNGTAAWAERAGIAYYDFNWGSTKSDIDWETETRDGGDHLNYYGALKFTQDLGALLASTYDLPDHRSDSAYQAWDDAYKRYLAKVEEA